MKLQGYRESFYTFSGKASDLARQLAFAAIALIWIFKADAGGRYNIPPDLFCPGILVILTLILDLAQYCAASIIWRVFYRWKEFEGVTEDTEIQHSPWLERPIWTLFVLKIVCIAAAYVLILRFLLKALGLQTQ
jgi:hypothetical protein